MRCSRMLQPTQPARTAFGPSGRRFSITVSAKKVLGISKRFLTCQSGEYCMTSKFGTELDRTAWIIELYAESTIFR